MDVTVQLFASYADAVGGSRLTVALDEPATVGELRRAIASLSPALPPRPLVAVNAEYADDSTAIHAGDEVAVIPPVTGG